MGKKYGRILIELIMVDIAYSSSIVDLYSSS